MSKSILVIDTPESCDYCPAGRIFGMAGQVECMVGKDIRVNNNGGTIPDWCPLQDLPKKKDMEPGKTIIRAAQHEGWNMCIDEILKGANGK